ncbi:hypothetical protein Pan216_41890 [Planctomycetes bacterium Pan216]|uniref:Uncharacterized protein n=1 Tax=Kolteria novifilia TaxID=2527975 RepID=A0A518B8L7_9BACT|nr:hypothetical protein Pan216_41890 [Planctomycetes bacterium Pan216]
MGKFVVGNLDQYSCGSLLNHSGFAPAHGERESLEHAHGEHEHGAQEGLGAQEIFWR